MKIDNKIREITVTFLYLVVFFALIVEFSNTVAAPIKAIPEIEFKKAVKPSTPMKSSVRVAILPVYNKLNISLRKMPSISK